MLQFGRTFPKRISKFLGASALVFALSSAWAIDVSSGDFQTVLNARNENVVIWQMA